MLFLLSQSNNSNWMLDERLFGSEIGGKNALQAGKKGKSAFVYLPVPTKLIQNAIKLGCLTWMNIAALC